jgi:hypothetical protein
MSDLRRNHFEAKSDPAAKLIAAFLVACAIFAGCFLVQREGWMKAPPAPVVTDNQLPSPGTPVTNGT